MPALHPETIFRKCPGDQGAEGAGSGKRFIKTGRAKELEYAENHAGDPFEAVILDLTISGEQVDF